MSWKDAAEALVDSLRKLKLAEQVQVLNEVRRMLHEAGPFSAEPVDCVEWIESGAISANDYNPNKVARPEMKLLEVSILADGYTQPIVTHDAGCDRVVVDGFHRSRVGKESDLVRKRVHGYIPCVKIRAEQTAREQRMASTIRHNRARGRHCIEPMAEIIAYVAKNGWSEAKIAKELGMELDEILRLRQIGGLAELYKDQPFSEAWELEMEPDARRTQRRA